MFCFSIQLGISSSQLLLTPSFFRGVGQPPTGNNGDHNTTQKSRGTGEMPGDGEDHVPYISLFLFSSVQTPAG